MVSYKFNKLMELAPTIYEEIVNSMGQKVQLAEHPLYGDEVAVIVIFPEHKKAFSSDFFDTDDMLDPEGDYVPHLVDDKLVYTYEL